MPVPARCIYLPPAGFLIPARVFACGLVCSSSGNSAPAHPQYRTCLTTGVGGHACKSSSPSPCQSPAMPHQNYGTASPDCALAPAACAGPGEDRRRQTQGSRGSSKHFSSNRRQGQRSLHRTHRLSPRTAGGLPVAQLLCDFFCKGQFLPWQSCVVIALSLAE